MSTTPKPPAPSKWATEAAYTISLRYSNHDWSTSKMNTEIIAEDITRHHAAAQAETVALLEECAGELERLVGIIDGEVDAPITLELAARLGTHLAQLKEGAP